ncbi:MAG: ribose 5-phosphate isomerase B [Candidatus Omnitrophota bacterium]
MKIFIAADHRGVELKQEIKDFLKDLGHSVVDMGTDNSEKPCDYPPLACKVAVAVAKNRQARGILVCMSGIGLSIAANKVPGAYAALCYNAEAARLSRQHNNANILVLGAKFVGMPEMKKMVKIWLDEKFEGGRHARRFRKIREIEKKFLKNI